MRARFVVVPLLVAGIPTGVLAATAVYDALGERRLRLTRETPPGQPPVPWTHD